MKILKDDGGNFIKKQKTTLLKKKLQTGVFL